MKTMIRMVAILCAASVSLGAAPARAAQGTKPSTKEGASLLPVPKDKQETAAYNEILNQTDPNAVLQSSEAFIAKYGTSAMLGKVYGRRMDAYLSMKNMFPEAIDELEKSIAFSNKFLSDRTKESEDKNSPQLAALLADNQKDEVLYYKRLVDAAQNANNAVVANYFGEEILKRIPDDFPTLMAVARVSAQTPPKDPKEKEEALARAEFMGQLAVNYVVAYLNSPNVKPPLTPEQKNEWAYRAHSLMGLIYNQKQAYADAEKAYLVALSYKKNDSAAYYYLGYAYYSEKNVDAAIDAELKSAFLKGPLEKGARSLLTVLYQAAKRPPEDLEKDILAAGERLK